MPGTALSCASPALVAPLPRFDLNDEVVELPYRLVVCGCDVPGETPANTTVLFTNPTNVLLADGPSLFMLTELFDEDEPLPVKYVSSLSFIYSARVRALGAQDPPAVLDMSFDLLREQDDMGVALISSSSWGYECSLKKFALNYSRPLVVVGEVSEVSPLARAEWTKFLGLLFKRSACECDVRCH